MPKITPGDETKGVSAGKPVVKLPRLRLPNIVFRKNNSNDVNSIRIPAKPYPKYNLQIEHVNDRVIIKAPVVNPTKTLIPQNQVKNKSDLDKSDIITIPAKVNPINH
jgi:virulence-associated protein VagC